MINDAQSNNKKIIIGVGGDYFADIPQYKNIIRMYLSPYKSKCRKDSIALPVIIKDPLKKLNDK